MHLNIPPKGESAVRWWTRSLKWVLLGVLIPELVVLAAWRQWLSARKMSRELEQIFKQQEAEKGAIPRRHKWTIEHSYYAGMGGFVFDLDRLPQGRDAVFTAPERLTLTASGVLLLARCGRLPDIDRESIWDKSKADGLSKTLVCIQAAWMIGQTLGRLVAEIPITLLEVNTLGHIFCAFIIYILWWRKPKEVKAPTVLEGRWTGDIASYMYMSSRISGQKLNGLLVLNKWIRPELAELAWYPYVDSDTSVASEDGSLLTPSQESATQSATDVINAVNGSNTERQSPDGELKRRPLHAITELPETVIKATPMASDTDEDAHIRQNRRSACAHAIQDYQAIRNQFQPTTSGAWHKPELAHLVTDVATNWPSDYYLPGIPGELMGMALWLSSSLYGGIHIAAWSDYFPTGAEKFLWRFSATFIASSGAIWLAACLIAFRWRWASEYWDRFIELRAWWPEYAAWGLLATACGLAYIFARVFLVVGAIVSLRRLPNAAYQTPDWTAVFPHL